MIAPINIHDLKPAQFQEIFHFLTIGLPLLHRAYSLVNNISPIVQRLKLPIAAHDLRRRIVGFPFFPDCLHIPDGT